MDCCRYRIGKILLVSADSVGELELAGKDGYNNGVQKLNDMCAKYADGKVGIKARSINVNDLNKLCGYNPSNIYGGGKYKQGEDWKYGNIATYTKNGDHISFKSSSATGPNFDTLLNKNGTELTTFRKLAGGTLAAGEAYTVKNEYYNYSALIGYKGNGLSMYQMKTVGQVRIFIMSQANADGAINYITGSYWLADKADCDRQRGASWEIRRVNVVETEDYQSAKATIDRRWLFNSCDDGNIAGKPGEYTETHDIRAVVYLNPDVEFSLVKENVNVSIKYKIPGRGDELIEFGKRGINNDYNETDVNYNVYNIK